MWQSIWDSESIDKHDAIESSVKRSHSRLGSMSKLLLQLPHYHNLRPESSILSREELSHWLRGHFQRNKTLELGRSRIMRRMIKLRNFEILVDYITWYIYRYMPNCLTQFSCVRPMLVTLHVRRLMSCLWDCLMNINVQARNLSPLQRPITLRNNITIFFTFYTRFVFYPCDVLC